MKLKDFARHSQQGGRPQPMIEDADLLRYAKWKGVHPADAQVEALHQGILPCRYQKNLLSLTMEEQAAICSSRVLVCGCGGLGGTALSLLARLGVGRVTLIDGDRFSASNLNRQRFCDTTGLGRPKVAMAAEQLAQINPLVRTHPLETRLDSNNARQLLLGSDLVIDGLDNIESRLLLADTARLLEIPFIHGAVAGWWGQVCTFLPESAVTLKNIYGSRTRRESAEQELGVLGATAAAVASFQVLEAARLLVGRNPAFADRLAYFDGETGTLESIPLHPR